jgi:hypothetical protein
MKCFSGQKPSDFAGFSRFHGTLLCIKDTWWSTVSVSVCESSFGVFVLDIRQLWGVYASLISDLLLQPVHFGIKQPNQAFLSYQIEL